MKREQFFKDPGLPFVECRYSTGSSRRFKDHMHRNLCIGAVDRGAVRYRVDNREALLTPGTLAVINPETLHSCNCLEGQERNYYMLYLDVRWCFGVQRAIWDVESFVPAEKIRLEDEDLYQRYRDTVRCLMSTTSHLLEKEQSLVSLCTEVFRHCRVEAERPQLPESIERLKRLLGENLREDLTLHSLAGILQVNPYTLLRRFKAVTGITPHAYRNNCRIEQARSYLRQGMDIAETALECGFFDQSHLHRHFKAITTVTPREYRVNFIQ